MHRTFPIFRASALVAILLAGCRGVDDSRVGPGHDPSSYLVPTAQWLHPAGDSLAFGGRPVDAILSRDGQALFIKDNRGVVVVDTRGWRLLQELPFQAKRGGSPHGLALSRDGATLWASTADNQVVEMSVSDDHRLALRREIQLPGPDGKGKSFPCGMTLSGDEATLWVCLSRNNSLGEVDLKTGQLIGEIRVGIAPYDVEIDERSGRAFVSNWGGRMAREGDRTAQSSGTPTPVDSRGVAMTGTISVVDLPGRKELSQIPVGLHPSDLLLSSDRRKLVVANANSDTVNFVSTETLRVERTVSVRPQSAALFGSSPNALAWGPAESTLYVANGGNNAVAVVALDGEPRVSGFIPAGWYPGSIVSGQQQLYIVNVKGVGSRNPVQKNGWNSHHYLGTATRVSHPSASELRAHTRRVLEDLGAPPALANWERKRSGRAVPVPTRRSERSLFDHVVYIIKENRTYDQVFGDLPQGNGDPNLCTFGRTVTPNQHALAEQFVLLDNYYCNGVLSADGHAWAMEGYATDYLEKSFGGFSRSYPYSGDDPVSFAPTGFIWDNVLDHGLTFRNYGEMAKSAPLAPGSDFRAIYRDHVSGAGQIRFKHVIEIDRLREFSCPDSPGWNLQIPDVIRADVFLKEFEKFEKEGNWPNLVIIYLPSDHTSGTRPGSPTPRAQVADNDLAVGRIVERISKSRFWPTTCIFANEDDPQAGFDHVDGHRSTCLVVSPYTRRGEVVHAFYNQTSVLHTMEQILGLPPMNQMDARAPVMAACFQSRADLRPFSHLPAQVPIDEMNPGLSELSGAARYWAEQSLNQNFDEVDRADEDILNRIVWHSVRGEKSYPFEWAGSHGRGLKKLGLKLSGMAEDDDD